MRIAIFDLDGTLIDSAPSILSALQAAFIDVGVVPSEPLTSKLIGPPLSQTLVSLLGKHHVEKLSRLVESFKAYYDEEGYKATRVYSGVEAMLKTLSLTSTQLYIATNKRIVPVGRIIEHLGWGSYFRGVYTLDRYSPPLSSKSALLRNMVIDLMVPLDDVVYIGDRLEDAQAAKENGIEFVFASWGYGTLSAEPEIERVAARPTNLLKILG
jgi:phosphoglycolate phosphatase